MEVISFLHQKGGTGKSTLAIACAMGLAAAGRRVILLDTDYQGTSSEWGNRFSRRFGIETRSQVQPIVHREMARFAGSTDFLLIDGPPSLSEMTESIVRCGGRLVLPVRPSPPDIWALPWIAAIIQKLTREGSTPSPLVVFNQVRGEALDEMRPQVEAYTLPVWPGSVPADPAFAKIFEGAALPEELNAVVGELLELIAPD